MKVLIYCFCFLFYFLVYAIILAFGIRLGAIPRVLMVGVFLFLGRRLCKIYDIIKEDRKNDVKNR